MLKLVIRISLFLVGKGLELYVFISYKYIEVIVKRCVCVLKFVEVEKLEIVWFIYDVEC